MSEQASGGVQLEKRRIFQGRIRPVLSDVLGEQESQ